MYIYSLFISYFSLFTSIPTLLLMPLCFCCILLSNPLNIYIYTLGLDYYPGIITHPGSLVPSSQHFTISAALGQGSCGRAQSSLFRPVAFSPMWVRIKCGMGNLLEDQALTLHTRNGGGTICPLLCEICYQIYVGLCLRIRAGVLLGAGSPLLSPQWSPCFRG